MVIARVLAIPVLAIWLSAESAFASASLINENEILDIEIERCEEISIRNWCAIQSISGFEEAPNPHPPRGSDPWDVPLRFGELPDGLTIVWATIHRARLMTRIQFISTTIWDWQVPSEPRREVFLTSEPTRCAQTPAGARLVMETQSSDGCLDSPFHELCKVTTPFLSPVRARMLIESNPTGVNPVELDYFLYESGEPDLAP